MIHSEQSVELNEDRALETLIYLRAEGASVKHVKLSGKRTKKTALAVMLLTDRVLQ